MFLTILGIVIILVISSVLASLLALSEIAVPKTEIISITKVPIEDLEIVNYKGSRPPTPLEILHFKAHKNIKLNKVD